MYTNTGTTVWIKVDVFVSISNPIKYYSIIDMTCFYHFLTTGKSYHLGN